MGETPEGRRGGAGAESVRGRDVLGSPGGWRLGVERLPLAAGGRTAGPEREGGRETGGLRSPGRDWRGGARRPPGVGPARDPTLFRPGSAPSCHVHASLWGGSGSHWYLDPEPFLQGALAPRVGPGLSVGCALAASRPCQWIKPRHLCFLLKINISIPFLLQ